MWSAQHRRRRRAGRVGIAALVTLALLLVGGGSIAYGSYRYDRAYVGRILPGITVDGVAVGNLTRAQAIQAIEANVAKTLSKQITITAGTLTWTHALSELGVSADVTAPVDRALRLSASYSWTSRAYRRLTNHPVHASFGVSYLFDPRPATSLVNAAAKQIGTRARDASFALLDGEIKIVKSKTGRDLPTTEGVELLTDALQQRRATVALPVSVVKPKVTDDTLGMAIVVNRTQNMLYLYDGTKITRHYPVATARQGFQTPPGEWHVYAKQVDPTWHNPAPNGWGKDEPLTIGPGPGDPLGTRALYTTAPGILIHGTPDDFSIGTYASHGCIRMHIADSEALFPLVPVGTPVFIIGAPPWGDTAAPGLAG